MAARKSDRCKVVDFVLLESTIVYTEFIYNTHIQSKQTTELFLYYSVLQTAERKNGGKTRERHFVRKKTHERHFFRIKYNCTKWHARV